MHPDPNRRRLLAGRGGRAAAGPARAARLLEPTPPQTPRAVLSHRAAARCRPRPDPGPGIDGHRPMVDKIISMKREKIGAAFGRLDDETLLRVNRALTVWLGVA
ncbi:MAG: hypothetical protein EA420_16830 [Candidatus Competibacteraceae bacterium]|nr:MAG: hypothetical protein EA420_16830 [Candidatus Competibacteraceae bacterium]